MVAKKGQSKAKKAAKRSASRKKKSKASLPESVDFDYIKSNFFRVIHVDGVHGGITPKGGIQVAFFSERQAIPTKETYTMERSGALGELKKKEGRQAIVREVEIEAILDLRMAKSFRAWLNDKIAVCEQFQEQGESDGE